MIWYLELTRPDLQTVYSSSAQIWSGACMLYSKYEMAHQLLFILQNVKLHICQN